MSISEKENCDPRFDIQLHLQKMFHLRTKKKLTFLLFFLFFFFFFSSSGVSSALQPLLHPPLPLLFSPLPWLFLLLLFSAFNAAAAASRSLFLLLRFLPSYHPFSMPSLSKLANSAASFSYIALQSISSNDGISSTSDVPRFPRLTPRTKVTKLLLVKVPKKFAYLDFDRLISTAVGKLAGFIPNFSRNLDWHAPSVYE